MQRAAARKLIRSTDLLRKEQDNDWPDSLEDYVQKIILRYPAQKKKLQYFLAQAIEPSADSQQFIINLDELINWISQEKRDAVKS